MNPRPKPTRNSSSLSGAVRRDGRAAPRVYGKGGDPAMLFAKRVFLIAGLYGLAVMAPQLFLESKTSADYPPAITHPEFYYGFVLVAIAWQVAFLTISRDP